MRALPKPPDWRSRLGEVVVRQAEPTIRTFVAEANREYLHWEKLRYRPLPEGLSAEDAWALVKLSRIANRKPLPLLDERAKPFTYGLPDSAIEVLHEVDRGGGGETLLAEGGQEDLKASRDQILVSSLMEEAIATSQIEGAVTTRKVAKEMLKTDRRPKNRSEQMIVNSYRTIRMLRTEGVQPLSLSLLLRIQEMMTAGTLDDESGAGRLRTPADNVQIVDTRDNEVVFVPPDAAELPKRLDTLIAFANAAHTGADFIHPLVKAAILHFWLAYEHPFIDGNGRTARALFYWQMLRAGYWLFEFLTISRIILAAPKDYYRSFLYSEHDGNDLNYSILFTLGATRRALSQLREYLAKKREEQRVFNSVWRVPDLNVRQREVLQESLQTPNSRFTFESHRHTNDISLLTARKDLTELADAGFLTRVREGKRFVFVPAADLKARIDRAGVKPRR